MSKPLKRPSSISAPESLTLSHGVRGTQGARIVIKCNQKAKKTNVFMAFPQEIRPENDVLCIRKLGEGLMTPQVGQIFQRKYVSTKRSDDKEVSAQELGVIRVSTPKKEIQKKRAFIDLRN